MKLKVLFILPVLILNALWWAPLAMASNPAPVGGGELSSDQKAKIDALKAEVKQLEGEVATANSKYESAKADYEFKANVVKNFDNTYPSCKANPALSTCQAMYSSALKEANSAAADKKTAMDAWSAKSNELDAKKAELAAASGTSGANDLGISNYSKGGTILPDTVYQQIADCEYIMRYVNNHAPDVKTAISSRQATITGLTVAGKSPSYTDIMGCAIKTGDVKFWMVPYFVRYILEFIIGIAGLASVAGIVYGGYFYLFAGLSDDQQKGKNAIKNSIIALVLSLSAWAIVNIVISLVTSI